MDNKLSIPETEKKFLCKIIRYNRKKLLKKTKQYRWTQDGFTCDSLGFKICSRKTLIGIEHENIKIKDEILEQLNDIDFNNICQKLKKAVEYYDVNRIIILSKHILKYRLKKFENYVIFHEYIIIFQSIINYYLKHELLSNDLIVMILHYASSLNEDIKDILFDLIFKTRFRKDNFSIQDLFLNESKFSINKINYILYLVNSSQTQYAIKEINHLLEYFNKTKNNIRQLDLESIQLSLCKAKDKEYFFEIYTSIENTINSSSDSLPKIKIAQICKNLGVTSFKLREYALAETYIKKFLLLDKRETLPYLVLLICIYEKEKRTSEILKLLESNKIISNKYGIFFKYYIMKYKKHYKESDLTLYIITEILSVFDEYDAIYINIFYEEMNYLTSKTFKYKDLKLYLSKIPIPIL